MPSEFEIVRSTVEGPRPLTAFDYLVEEAQNANLRLVPRAKGAVRSIELQWADKRKNPFSIQVRPNHLNFYLRRPILRAHPRLFDLASERFGEVKPNSLGEYRIRIHSEGEAQHVLSFLIGQKAWPKRGGPAHRTSRNSSIPGSAPYAATNQNLLDHGLEPAFRWLIAAALDGTTITYGEIKRRLEQEAGFSTVFATRIGLVAGALMDRIQQVEPMAPLINVIVVNQQDRMPSKGAGGFLATRFGNRRLANEGYKDRYPEKWRAYFERAAAEVYAYSPAEWSALYARVFNGRLRPSEIVNERVKRQLGNEDDFGTGNQKYGAGGEGKYHRALRLWITANPAKVRPRYKAARPETEFSLDSGDRIDVVYHLDDRTVVLEVKSRISNDVDLRRGVYQCIKYRAVKAAMDVRNEVPVEAILVTETELPGEISALLKMHDIRHYQAPLSRS